MGILQSEVRLLIPVTEDRVPRTARLPVGTDRVEAAPDGAVWLICAQSKGWTARRGTAHSTAEYPGTAVRWETELFEVVEAVTHPDGTVRYRLLAWEDRHVVRSIRDYNASTERERSSEQASHKKSIAKRRLAILFSPLLGHLPGWVQSGWRGQLQFVRPDAQDVVNSLAARARTGKPGSSLDYSQQFADAVRNPVVEAGVNNAAVNWWGLSDKNRRKIAKAQADKARA